MAATSIGLNQGTLDTLTESLERDAQQLNRIHPASDSSALQRKLEELLGKVAEAKPGSLQRSSRASTTSTFESFDSPFAMAVRFQQIASLCQNASQNVQSGASMLRQNLYAPGMTAPGRESINKAIANVDSASNSLVAANSVLVSATNAVITAADIKQALDRLTAIFGTPENMINTVQLDIVNGLASIIDGLISIVTKAPELKPILDILAAIMPSVNCIYDNIIGPAIEFGCAFIPS